MSNKNDIVTYKELQNDERLSDYLRGNMTKDGEAAFFDDLKSDKEQGAQAVSIAYLSKATKEIGEKNDNDVKEALLSIRCQCYSGKCHSSCESKALAP